MSPGKDLDLKKGHRERLRKRFLKGGRKALADYELLELLLTYVIPRKDTKPLAKALIQEYRSFSSALDQSPDKLHRDYFHAKPRVKFVNHQSNQEIILGYEL